MNANNNPLVVRTAAGQKLWDEAQASRPNPDRLFAYMNNVGVWKSEQVAEARAKAQAEARAKAQAEAQINKRVQMVVFRSSRMKRARQAAPTG